ncbi:MAG: insulinase family protein [Acidobacteria bacterium]|nr:insulinase family protein [Acidobacteriota bacterium]
MSNKISWLAGLGFLVCSFPQCLAAQQYGVSAHTLSNGTRILVHEDHDIPDAVLTLFFRIGSRNERPGITGISHFFEHMMFNGARKYGPKQFDIVMERNGGSNNAYTAHDVTVYTDWFPSDRLELIMGMEADRIQYLSFDPKMVESERNVVRNERLMKVDNRNSGLLLEQLEATAFLVHPYRRPVLGWAADINAWTVQDLETQFHKGYAPNNCVLVAAGDVTDAEVLRLAKEYFERIPSHEPPPPVRVREPEQLGERRVLLRRPAELPLEYFAYHVPPTNGPEHPAVSVLASVLAAGASSRLSRRLVDRDQLALSVSHWNEISLDPGLLVFSIQPKSGVDPERVERAFRQEVARVRQGGITAKELEKAKNELLTSHFERMKTNSGFAELLGEYEIYFGDYRRLFTAAQEMERVSAADVRRAADRYLTSKNLTVATLIPEKQETSE